jgi:hypothetical protein
MDQDLARRFRALKKADLAGLLEFMMPDETHTVIVVNETLTPVGRRIDATSSSRIDRDENRQFTTGK